MAQRKLYADPPLPPRRTLRGRPRGKPEPAREDGYCETVVRNLILRYGAARVRGMIRRWRNGASDGAVARHYAVTPATARRWRRALGISVQAWQPFAEINAIAGFAEMQDCTESAAAKL